MMGYFQPRTGTSGLTARRLHRNQAQRLAVQITVNTRRRAAAACGLTLVRGESGLLTLVSANRSGETTDLLPRGTGDLSW